MAGKTLDDLTHWDFDLAFLSVEGMTAEGLWNSLPDIVALQRTVMKATSENVFCVDTSKVGQAAPDLLVPFDGVDTLICDASAAELKQSGIDLSLFSTRHIVAV